MMNWWAGKTCTALYAMMFPRRRFIAWGMFFWGWLIWMGLKMLVYFYVALFLLLANVVQLVLGSVVCLFQLAGRGLKAVAHWARWAFDGPTTSAVEEFFRQ